MARRVFLIPAVLAILGSGCERPAPSPEDVTTFATASGCEPQQGCAVRGESVSMQLRFLAPPHALKPFPVQLLVTTDQQVESVVIAFSMAGMDMGLNRYRMVRDPQTGNWGADVTLPMCVSGRSDWIAGVDLVIAGRDYRWTVPFVVQR